MLRMDYAGRQKQFQQTLIDEELDGFVVTHPANLRYLCGYTGSNGLLLFLAGRRVFFTDGRYTQQAREEVKGARVVIARGPLLTDAAKIIGKMSSAAIGFESDLTTVATAAQMKELVHRRIEWKPTSGLIMRQRMIKDAEELKFIRDAVKLGAKVYQQAAKAIRPACARWRSRASSSLRRGRRGPMECRLRPSWRRGSGERCRMGGRRGSRSRGAGSWWWIRVLYCGAIVLT